MGKNVYDVIISMFLNFNRQCGYIENYLYMQRIFLNESQNINYSILL